MECNKEEAIRAKEIAEKKMQNDDFEGARKLALKAQQLFADLENISQLLAVCDVHCSAQNRIFGSEKDWYGILQIQKFANEATIKKQYRRLALVLHPDKNKLPGAEAAFKLIGEANMVLSDQTKRSLYDSKCQVSVKTSATRQPPHQVNRNPYVRKQYEAQTNIPNVSNSQFSGLNNQQQTSQPGFTNSRQTFWTCCPFCSMKYQYYRDIANRPLRCHSCSKPFIAYEIVPQAPKFEAFKVGSQKTGGTPSSHVGSQATFSTKTTVNSEPVFRARSSGQFGGASKTKGKEGVGMPNTNAAKPKESVTSRNTSKSMKRGRKMVVESSESSDTATSSETDEDVVIEESSGNRAEQTSGLNGVNPSRRSSRQRQRVSYNERLSDDDDDDFASPPKRSRGNESSQNGKEERKEAMGNGASETENSASFVKGKGGVAFEGGLPDRNVENGIHKGNGEEAEKVDGNGKEPKVVDDSDVNSDSNINSNPEPEYYDCPDPEFNDFDKDKEENCFAVDQMWACYDTLDGMPRFYARVRKVFSPGFRLRITWLEPDIEDEHEMEWFNEGLPVACGKFVFGSSEETTDRLTFSHQVHFEKGTRRNSFLIYPRKGEIWALFKDWDISWSSKQEKDTKYNFDVVEVISDFVENSGIRVVYLDKVKGFISLFQRMIGNVSFLIPSSQLLRFSHRIPSFRMTGGEREGVPEGSIELDPASLPSNLNDVNRPDDGKMEADKHRC